MSSLEFGRKWTDDEITKLCDYVRENGTGSWKAVSAFIGSRSAASCRQRWVEFHESGVRTGKFTHQEMLTALLLQSKCGNRWSKITKYLPGRTTNQVKNFYNKAVKKKAADFPVALIRNLVEKIEGQGKSMESCLLPIAYEELIRLQTKPPPATAGGATAASSSTSIAADSDLLMPPEIPNMIIIPNFTDPPAEIPYALPHLQPQDGGFDDLIPPAEVPVFGGAGAAYSSFDDIPDIWIDSGFSDFAGPLEIPQDDLNELSHDVFRH